MTRFALTTAALAAGALTSIASAGSHSWRFNEIFSNADGTIQFIEMKECCGANNEVALNNKWVRSLATLNQYTFTMNLPSGTANKHLLLATAGFAALPGAPTPDFIIGDNFFHLTADELRYWTYAPAFMIYGAGDLPLDGTMSLQIDGTQAVNTPTNFAGESGSVSVPSCPPADVDGSGAIDFADLLAVLASWGPCVGCPADVDGDGTVGFADLLAVLAAWGSC